MKRAAFYIDGFNLYHAVLELEEPFLKWCNLWKLAERVIPARTEKLVKVVLCTAYYPGDPLKKWRHDEFLKALRIYGVDIVMGHYVHEPKECTSCGDKWRKPTEKETDINVALSLYHDAWNDVFDKAYLLSADSDQAATARFFTEHFKDKEFVTVAPPGRNFSSHIEKYTQLRIALNKDHMDACVMPAIVMSQDGKLPAARRPREYDPPKDWVHPDNRPKPKKENDVKAEG